MRQSVFAALLIALVVMLTSAVAAANARVLVRLAVLELRNEANLSVPEVAYLTDIVRGVATRELRGDLFLVLTRESIQQLLPNNVQLSDCLTGECEVMVGRKLGVDYIVTGEVLRFGDELRLNLKAHHCASGAFLGNETAGGAKLVELEPAATGAAVRLFGLVRQHAGVVSEDQGLPNIVTTSPPSKRGAVSATPEARRKGSEWLAAAAKAAGGSASWAAIKTVTVSTVATLSMQGQSIGMSGEETWSFPNRQVVVQKLPFGEIRQGYDGKTGWMSGMGQSRENPKAAEEVAKDYERSLWRLFSDPGKIELVALEQPEKVGEASYRAAAVTGAKSRDLALLFAEDGTFAGCAYQDTGGQMGPARVVELLSSWGPEGTLTYPHTFKVLRDGSTFVEGKLTALELNPAVTDAMFVKPKQ